VRPAREEFAIPVGAERPLQALQNNEMQLTRSAWLTDGRPSQLISVLGRPVRLPMVRQ
jgi:hypothetical protein